MTLDNEDFRIIRERVLAQKGRSDFIAGLSVFAWLTAVAVVDIDIAEEPPTTDRFLGIFEAFETQVLKDVSADEEEQYRRIHRYFLEAVNGLREPSHTETLEE